MFSMRSIAAQIGRYGEQRWMKPIFGALNRRPFDRGAEKKVLVLYEPMRISFSQVFPFLMYSEKFANRYGADFRLLTTSEVLEEIPAGLSGATHVFAQTWLTDAPEKLEQLRKLIGRLPYARRLVYLDSFANADIRLARNLTEFDLYYKKSIFRDAADHLCPTEGHTNLTEYYGRLYGQPQERTDWGVPPDFLAKLRLAPNFLTGPNLASGFFGEPPPQQWGRDIDLHARLGGTKRNNWYGAMRRDAEARVMALADVRVATGTGISRKRFMDELRRSKICFSPFGYGELCWRDIEAILAGAVLLKPDMSHLLTEPDLYRDGETYVAVRWDFADLEEKTRSLLADDRLRTRIAGAAWETARRYLHEAGPVATYADAFTE